MKGRAFYIAPETGSQDSVRPVTTAILIDGVMNCPGFAEGSETSGPVRGVSNTEPV